MSSTSKVPVAVAVHPLAIIEPDGMVIVKLPVRPLIVPATVMVPP